MKLPELNDRLREHGEGGEVLASRGVNALEDATRQKVFSAIKDFTDFTEGNDPYGEHDFGMVEVEDERYFWKIDYYSKSNPGYGSENPADPSVTRRVMTIMQAVEY